MGEFPQAKRFDLLGNPRQRFTHGRGILFSKICTTVHAGGARAPLGALRTIGRGGAVTSGVRKVRQCRRIRTPCAEFRACAPRSLRAVCPGASSAGPPEASAGKVVQAREAVAWQAPVGPSDDGIRGSMDASAPDERKTPVTGVLIFVGRADRPLAGSTVSPWHQPGRTGVCAHRRQPGRHRLHDPPL